MFDLSKLALVGFILGMLILSGCATAPMQRECTARNVKQSVTITRCWSVAVNR